ncbi:MAG: hypothetical protein JOZ55_10230 [Alphaproteobacteria bacterium]|nr:hypothetical protein [Alphaproteobacteria bacterium]
MRRSAIVVSVFFLALISAASAAPAVHPRLVYRVDRVSAFVDGKQLAIAVSGAVASGGYSHPRLKAKPARRGSHILLVQFLADPPPANRTFVQELLPIAAEMRMPAPRMDVAAITVSSQSNEITSEVRR